MFSLYKPHSFLIFSQGLLSRLDFFVPFEIKLTFFSLTMFFFCLHSRFQLYWVPEDGETILKCPVSLQSWDAPGCSTVNARTALSKCVHIECAGLLVCWNADTPSDLFVCVSQPGEAMVRQSGSSTNSQRAAGCGASFSAWRATQEPLRQNVLPPWSQVYQPPPHREF